MPAGETERSTDPASFVLELRRAFRYETAGSRVFDDPGTWVDTIAPYVTEDFTCVMNGGAMITEHSGVEGLREGWTDFTAAFETIGIQPGELRRGADGESVVEFVRLVGKPVGADGEVEQPAAAVWFLREGRLRRVEFFIDQAAALRAGGLDPEDPGPPVG